MTDPHRTESPGATCQTGKWGGACAKGRMWEGRTGTKRLAAMNPGARTGSLTRVAATASDGGVASWTQQRWTKHSGDGSWPGSEGWSCDAPWPWPACAADVAGLAHPGMVPHLIALSAKQVASRAETRGRIKGFTPVNVASGGPGRKGWSRPGLQHDCPHRAVVTRTPNVLDQAGTGRSGG